MLSWFSLLRSWVFWIAIVVAIGLGYWWYAGSGTGSWQTLTVQQSDFHTDVAVSGTVSAAHDVDLGFAQSGRVSGVYASVGDTVSAGAVLAEVENGDLRAALSQKKAALLSAEANLQALQAGTRPEELAITQAAVASDQTSLSQSEVALTNAIESAYTVADAAVHNTIDQFLINPRTTSVQLSFVSSDSSKANLFLGARIAIEPVLAKLNTDIGALSSNGAVPPDVVTEAGSVLDQVSALLASSNSVLNAGVPSLSTTQAMLNTWIAAVGTARTSVNSASTALTAAITAESAAEAALTHDQKTLALQEAGATAEDIAAQQALVAAAQADVANVQAQLDKTRVVAPFAGTVSRMDAKVGAIVSPNDPQISMMSNGLFEIDCYIPEVEIAGVSVGDSATTTLDAYGPNVSFAARVIAIDPAETEMNGVPTYKTTLQFLAPDPRIRSGMTVNADIQTNIVPRALVVPQGAIFQKEGVTYVQVLQSGKPVDVAVQKGIASSVGNVQIVSGLSAGNVVILNPDTSR